MLNCLLLAATMLLPPFGEVRIVDQIDCTKMKNRFVEYPEGASRVETILGRRCLVMPVQEDEGSFFKFRLGWRKKLKANGSYVIVLEYPDDVPRNYNLINRATDSHRSFSTGSDIGDAFQPKYTEDFAEYLELPQSGEYRQWKCFTTVCDRFGDYKDTVVGGTRLFMTPADGFDFVICQYAAKHDPFNHGIAVSKLILCEIPDETKLYNPVQLPGAGLPRRRLFWREEMSDGCAIQGEESKRMCKRHLDWFEHKARQMKMFGFNCYMKDLMEFGRVQHWDPSVIRADWAWSSAESWLWEKVVELMGSKHGFEIFPYYEWDGPLGAEKNGVKTLGYQRRAEPLSGSDKGYTHVAWCEDANIDITDPEALEETKNLLDATIIRYKNKARFVGAMFRARPTSWPVSFSDATRQYFAREANGGVEVSREELRADENLYSRYIAWWQRRRAAFLGEIRRHLATNGVDGACVVFDGCTAEGGGGIGGAFCVEDEPAFRAALEKIGYRKAFSCVSPEEARSRHLYLEGRGRPAVNWGSWEWHHACPADNPSEFGKESGVALAMPVNRLFSVNDSEAFAAYADANGGVTMIRHHALNENMIYKLVRGKEERLCGYMVASDYERAGRASRMLEVEAMARGNPVNIGYLVGTCFATGFPEEMMEFNRNFLALPALPMTTIAGACADKDVVLREIDAGAAGKYYALVHTGRTAKKAVAVKFPDGTTKLFDLKPWQLKSICPQADRDGHDTGKAEVVRAL